ncbi:MAG: hypothetical protein FD135_3295 [Comamonadaceae bacterium]|nr:MAG: hypothetical protein FD135_3295 [Comamonadaceae bacterium]
MFAGVTGNFVQAGLPIRGLQELAQLLHFGLLQRRLQAHQVIALISQRDKTQTGLLCGCGNAQACITLARGHCLCNGGM